MTNMAYRKNNYEDCVDFFTEKKITVEDKKASIAGTENYNLAYVQGLENLVKQFSQHNTEFSFSNLNAVQGTESYIPRSTNSLNDELSDHVDFCFSLTENNTEKLQKKIKNLSDIRKKGSVKTKPIKMKTIVKKLGTSKNVTSDPLWVPTAVSESIKFTGGLMTAIFSLIKYVNQTPKTKEEKTALELNIFSDLGKILTGGSFSKSTYTTDVLPGNMVFNLKLSDSFFNKGILAFYTDVKKPVNVISETCLPTVNLIDECTGALERYLNLFTSYGHNLSRPLIAAARKGDKVNRNKTKETNGILLYLIDIVKTIKRLLKAMFKLVNQVTDAVYDFILQGIK